MVQAGKLINGDLQVYRVYRVYSLNAIDKKNIPDPGRLV